MEVYNIVVAALVAIIIALVVAFVLITRANSEQQVKVAVGAIGATRDAFPPAVTQLIAVLLGIGANVATKTPTQVDDVGFDWLAQIFGYQVKTLPDGRKELVAISPQPVAVPPPGEIPKPPPGPVENVG